MHGVHELAPTTVSLCKAWRTGQDCHSQSISEIASSATTASSAITLHRLTVGNLRGAIWESVFV